jgi:hypothetical protein
LRFLLVEARGVTAEAREGAVGDGTGGPNAAMLSAALISTRSPSRNTDMGCNVARVSFVVRITGRAYF